jgi:uncharacterized protein YukE
MMNNSTNKPNSDNKQAILGQLEYAYAKRAAAQAQLRNVWGYSAISHYNQEVDHWTVHIQTLEVALANLEQEETINQAETGNEESE